MFYCYTEYHHAVWFYVTLNIVMLSVKCTIVALNVIVLGITCLFVMLFVIKFVIMLTITLYLTKGNLH
jgi:hypothetical protein